MSCQTMLRHAKQCQGNATTDAMLSHSMPFHTIPCHVEPCQTMSCHATLHHAMWNHAMLCSAVPCQTEPFWTIPRPCHMLPFCTTPSHSGGSECSLMPCSWPGPELPCAHRCVRITDTGLSYLSTMSSLRSLYLRWCCQVGAREHTAVPVPAGIQGGQAEQLTPPRRWASSSEWAPQADEYSTTIWCQEVEKGWG